MEFAGRRIAYAGLLLFLPWRLFGDTHSQCARDLAQSQLKTEASRASATAPVGEGHRVLSSLFPSSPLLFPPVSDKDSGPWTPEDHWRESGLRFEALETLVRNRICYRTQIHFLMCVAAMQSLISFGEDRTVLLPHDREEISPFFGRTIANHGAVDLVESAAPPIDDPQLYVRFSRSLNKAVRRAWLRVYEQDDRSVNFDLLRPWIRAAYVHPEREAYITAVALNHAIREADPHARLETNSEMQENRTGGLAPLVGIGVTLAYVEGKIVIREVQPEGPAHAAGVRLNDLVTHLDEVPVNSLKPAQRSSRLTGGGAGTSLRLTVRRQGKPLTFEIVRREIPIPNVEARYFATGKEKIGYLRVRTFLDRDAGAKAEGKIKELVRQGARSLVLDLRGNQGGAMGVTLDLAGLFLGPGKPVVTVKSLTEGIVDQTYFTKKALLTGVPLVVLINATSASGAELLAGALQDYGRAVTVGERSFGKGSVQHSRDVASFRGPFHGLPIVLWQTAARFFLPSGFTNQRRGIQPDWEVPRDPTATEEEGLILREEDIHHNALSAESERVRPGEDRKMRWLKTCLETQGRAKSRFHAGKSEPYPLDYQLLHAVDAARCLELWEADPESLRPGS